ncbi:MAG: hypothetical protein Q8P02_02210 [Candidatus Micrarchaeota archaeon]|nr:hypothetical protein [Candidatus Micrarchaeota archaeon]
MLANLRKNHEQLSNAGYVLRANREESYFLYAPSNGNARSAHYHVHVNFPGPEPQIRVDTLLHRGTSPDSKNKPGPVVNARLRRGTGTLGLVSLQRAILEQARRLEAAGKKRAAKALHRRVGKMDFAVKHSQTNPLNLELRVEAEKRVIGAMTAWLNHVSA